MSAQFTIAADELSPVMEIAVKKGLDDAKTQEEKAEIFVAALIEYRMQKDKK